MKLQLETIEKHTIEKLKKLEKLLKENYRPVRILSILSKVFEKSMSKFLNIFLKYQYHGCLLNKAKSANKQFIQ